MLTNNPEATISIQRVLGPLDAIRRGAIVLATSTSHTKDTAAMVATVTPKGFSSDTLDTAPATTLKATFRIATQLAVQARPIFPVVVIPTQRPSSTPHATSLGLKRSGR
jgi:hypothetical protein